MDPITLIVTALATGAVAGLKPTAEKVVKDAYDGLKAIIKDKYERSREAVPVLENDPASTAGKAVVRESLEKDGAGQDEALLRQAQAVLKAVEEREPTAAEAAGVRIEDIRSGASVNIRRIVSAGAFSASNIEAEEDVSITDVRTGRGGGAPGKAGGPDV